MLELILILIGIVVAFLLFFWFAATFTARRFAAIASRHRDDTEWLLQTGIAPREWSEPQQRRVRALEQAGASTRRLERAKSAGKELLVARLERHLRHLERATVIPNERMRDDITDRIRYVGRTWESSTWEQIVGEEEFDPPTSVEPGR